MALLVLSSGDSVGLSLGTFNIIGTRGGSETVVLNEPSSGSLNVTLDPSFNQGGDSIVLAGTASDYTIVRSGSSVVLTNGTISVTIPVGTAGAEVVFANGAGAGDDDARTLIFDTQQGKIFLGDQDVGFQSEQVDADGPAPAPITVSVDSPSVTEGDSGTKTVTFTLTLSEAPTEATTVNYSTSPGTATPNDDYIPQSGTVTFAAGQTSATVAVTVNGDLIDESNETFNLTASLNGESSTGVATIIDNDEVQAVFTPGTDTLVGTSADDTFLARNNDLGAGDSVNGLGGDDTVILAVDNQVQGGPPFGLGPVNYGGFTTNSVENFVVTNDAGRDVNIDLSGATGLETVESTNSSASTSFNQLKNLVDVAITDQTNDVNDADVTVRFQDSAVVGASDEINLLVSDSLINTVQIGSNDDNNEGIEVLNLNVEGDSVIENLDADVETLNIAGSGNIEIETLNSTANLMTVDATNASGDLTIDFSGAGNPVDFTGSTGDDNVTGSANGDTYDTRAGDDQVFAGSGDDDITTGEGEDTINTGGGDDVVSAGDDDDAINVEGAGTVDVDMGDGDDVTNFRDGDFDASIIVGDIVNGGDGRDTLGVNEDLVDSQFAQVSNVEVLDLLDGGNTLTLGGNAEAAGIDEIRLSAGSDVVNAGGMNNDLTITSTGLDGGGDDIVTTGDGDDTFNFGDNFDGDDNLDAGEGFDTLNVSGGFAGGGAVNGNGFSRFEQLNLEAGGDYNLTLDNNNEPDLDGDASTTETLTVDGGRLTANDIVTFDSSGVTEFDIDLTTGAADDTVTLGGTNNTVSTGDGDDQVFGNLGAGTSTIITGEDDDNVDVTSDGSVEVISGDGDDRVWIHGSGDKIVNSGDGDDTVHVEGNAEINLGTGNDTLEYFGELNNGQTVNGGDDIDTVAVQDLFGPTDVTDALFTDFSNFEVVDNQGTGDVTIGLDAQTAGIRTVRDSNSADSTYDASGYSADLLVDLRSGSGDDVVTTGSGDDTVLLSNVAATNDITLGGGNDTVNAAGTSLDITDVISGGTGDDTIELSNNAGQVDAAVDLSGVTSIENYVLTASGNTSVGVDVDDNTLLFIDGTASGDALIGTATDINIDAGNLIDADDSFTVTVDASMGDADYGFILDGAGAGVDVTFVKNNVGVNNDVIFNGAASNDSLVINGDDLGATITFTGGDGTDSVVQNGGIIDDDGYRNVRGVEILSAAAGTTLDATLGEQAERSGLQTIILGETGADNVVFDAAFDGAVTVDLRTSPALATFGGADTVDGGATDAVFTFLADTTLGAGDLLTGGSTASDVLTIETGDGDLDNVFNARGVVGVETINVVTGADDTVFDDVELRIDTLSSEVVGGAQTINVELDGLDNFTLTGAQAGFVATADLTVNLDGVVDATIETGTGDDIINGGDTSGTLTVRSGDGDDVINAEGAFKLEAFGGDGDDEINGGAGDDVLAGGLGADIIDGGAGDDDIMGGDGNDELTAGAGADRIQGGAGADMIILSNDNEVDTVFYDSVSESAGAINRDTITGFESGTDIIDITAIDAVAVQGFEIEFLGNVNTFADAQTSVTAGSGKVQAVYDQVNDILYFDVDDNGILDGDDIQIVVKTEGDSGLVAQDVLNPREIVGGDSLVVQDNSPEPFNRGELQTGEFAEPAMMPMYPMTGEMQAF